MRSRKRSLLVLMTLALYGAGAHAQFSLWIAPGEALSAVAAEIEKAVHARQKTREAVESYRIQEELRRDSVEITEEMTQKAHACSDVMNAEQIGKLKRIPAYYAMQKDIEGNAVNITSSDDIRAQIVANADRSIEKFCSAYDEAMGRCTMDKPVPSGDILATSLLSPLREEGDAGDTFNAHEIEAAEAYVDRLVPLRNAAAPLPFNCDTEQCKAYEELRKRNLAIQSAARHSLNVMIGRRISPLDVKQQPGLQTPDKGYAGS